MEPSAVVTSDYEIAGADEIQQFLVNAYSTSIRTRSDDRPHRLHHHRDALTIGILDLYLRSDNRSVRHL